MQKPWLKYYPPTLPPEINPDSFASVADLFASCCQRFAARPSFTCMGSTISYAELDRLSGNFASYLQYQLGLKKGDRIALQMPNVLQYPIAIFGALRAGLVVVNTNPLYTPREMEHQFKDSGAKAIVILSNFCDKLEQVLHKTPIEHVIVTDFGDLLDFPKSLIVNFVVKHVKKMVPAYNLPNAIDFRRALDTGALKAPEPVALSGSDPAFLQYTGGTTGVAKGATLTHRNLVANMEQIAAIMSVKLRTEPQEVAVTALPLYHIFCLTVNGLSMMKIGALNVLIPNPRDFKAFAKELQRQPFTFMSGVNTLFNGMVHAPEFQQVDWSRLKIAVGGGMAVQQSVSELWKRMTGMSLVEGYGLTEASPVLSVNRPDLPSVGSIGLPLSSTELCVMDDDGNLVKDGEVGELCARGPQVMQGYWNRPEETAKVITKDGWLKTGDMALYQADSGTFKIVDRKKDMILVSGFNVYPNEVEEVVSSHPGVKEVCAIGVPDDKSGEAVKIFVVKKDEALSADDLKQYCKKNLTAYKLPRYIEFRDDLPKTNVGKILRKDLRDQELKQRSNS